MTYSESLSRIKRNVNPKFWNAEDIEHYNNIVNAIEKQILKKPVNKTLEYDGEYGCCPCCNTILVDYKNTKRCGDCGQALDWSDAE